MDTQDRNMIGSALHGGAPLKSYKKTILGQAFITIWNSFENAPEGLIMAGDPEANDDGCIIDIWSADEDFYFKNKNKRHLQTGVIVEYTRKNDIAERTVEQYTDEELETLLEEKFKKFFSFQNLINSTKSVALLFRIKNIAQANDKSDKIIKSIEARISEVQAEEFKPMPSSITKAL